MKGNIKWLVFGVCVAFALFGTFISVASATTGYVEEGESIQVGNETAMPFYNDIITPHRMPSDRLIEDGEYLAHDDISFYKHSVPKHKLDKQITGRAGTQASSSYDGATNSTIRKITAEEIFVPEEWNKTFGGRFFDVAYSVEQTADGGYIIAGETGSYGDISDDFWLVKTDANGNRQWDKTFGGDEAYSVQQTTDGGYIVAGGKHGSWDFWLVKTDANGNKEWDKTFGEGEADSVEQTTDGGYIVAGRTSSYGAGCGDFWLVKTDASGNKEWNKTFGGSGDDWADSVEQTTDGGYIIAGGTWSYGAGYYGNFWLVKTDANGNKQWDKTLGGYEAYSVQQTTDGGYIIAGGTESKWYGACYSDFLLVKTDANGNKEWDKTFGGSGHDVARSVEQTADGGYIIARATTYWSIII